MMAVSFELPSPGASPKRAQAVVFLIEQEAARTRDVRDATTLTAMPGDVPIDLSSLLDDTARDLETPTGDALHDLSEFRLAKRPTDEVNAKVLERTAAVWAPLVPDNPLLRAQILLVLLKRYAIVAVASSHLRSALGADDPEVKAAFETLGQGSLESHYADPSAIQKFFSKFRR
jgi:hypothetical protein